MKKTLLIIILIGLSQSNAFGKQRQQSDPLTIKVGNTICLEGLSYHEVIMIDNTQAEASPDSMVGYFRVSGSLLFYAARDMECQYLLQFPYRWKKGQKQRPPSPKPKPIRLISAFEFGVFCVKTTTYYTENTSFRNQYVVSETNDNGYMLEWIKILTYRKGKVKLRFCYTYNNTAYSADISLYFSENYDCPK